MKNNKIKKDRKGNNLLLHNEPLKGLEQHDTLPDSDQKIREVIDGFTVFYTQPIKWPSVIRKRKRNRKVIYELLNSQIPRDI